MGPIFPIVNLLFLDGCRHFKKFPIYFKYFLLFFALTQIIPSFGSQNIFQSLFFSTLKILLISGLISVGFILRNDEKPFKYFSFFAFFSLLCALLYTYVYPSATHARLSHPYMTSTTLGIVSGYLMWFSLFSYKKYIFLNSIYFIMGLVCIVISGSRGVMFSVFLSIFIGMLSEKSHKKYYLYFFVSLGVIAIISMNIQMEYVQRLYISDLSGRSALWYQVMTLINEYPIFGVGHYQLGRYLTVDPYICPSFHLTAVSLGICNSLFNYLGNPWIIAHNMVLQEIAQSGIFGFLGMYIVVFFCLKCILSTPVTIIRVIGVGSMFFNIFDNTFLLPTHFFGEFFWIASGMAIRYHYQELPSRVQRKTIFFSFVLLIIPFLPILYTLQKLDDANHTKKDFSVYAFQEDKYNISGIMFGYRNIIGDYEANVFSCLGYCQIIGQKKFSITKNEEQNIYIDFSRPFSKENRDNYFVVHVIKNGTLYSSIRIEQR